MAIIAKAAIAKKDGEFIHPETCANAVWYDEEKGITVKQKIDEILEEMSEMVREPTKITAFTGSSISLEKGGQITSITFNYSFNREPKEIELKIGDNTYYPDITGLQGTYKANGLNIRDNTTCHLTIKDNKNNTTTSNKNINVMSRILYGTAENFESFIKPIANNPDSISQLKPNREMTLTIYADEGNYIYFCYPLKDKNDVATFIYDNFPAGFNLIGVVDITISYNKKNGSFNYSNNKIKEITNDNREDKDKLGDVSIINKTDENSTNITTTLTYAVYRSDYPGLELVENLQIK